MSYISMRGYNGWRNVRERHFQALGEYPAGYDAVVCIGAPFAIGSFEDAVGWMLEALKPPGVLAIGDVFLQTPLAKEVSERESIGVGDYRTLEETAAVLEAYGLCLDGMIAASPDDWDRYASGSWRAAYAWAAANPDEPDRAEISDVW